MSLRDIADQIILWVAPPLIISWIVLDIEEIKALIREIKEYRNDTKRL